MSFSVFRFFYWLNAFLLSVVSVKAQLLTITDSETKLPLDEVSVWSNVPAAYGLTNAQGQLEVGTFEGSTKMLIARLGYEAITFSYADIQQQGFQLALKPSTLSTKSAVVISANRWLNSPRFVPARVSVIARSSINLMNPQTAADLLAQTGEVFVQKSQQGGGSPMIRGFATNRLLYSVDGVRMNTAIFRGGNIQNVISLDALSLESAEVLFGPGSVLYGSDAIGAVMRFETLKPRFSTGDAEIISGSATTRYASASNELTVHADVNVANRKWSYLSSFTHSRFGDMRMGRFGPQEYLRPFFVQRVDSADQLVQNPDPLVQTPGGYQQLNLMQKLAWRPNSAWQIDYAFHYSETSEYARYDRLIATQNNGLPLFAVWNYGPQTWMMNQITIDHRKARKLFDQFSARLAWQQFGESRIDRRFNQNRLRTQQEEVQAYSVNFDFVKHIGKHQLQYGAEWVFNNVQSNGSAVNIATGAPIAVPDRYPSAQWNSAAVYAHYSYRWGNSVMLNAAARANFYSLTADFTRHLSFFPFNFSQTQLQNQALTGSLGIVYSPKETLRLYASLSNAFRAPNVDDIGKIFEFGEAEVVVPNPQLAAETAWNAEFGLDLRPAKWLRFELSAYYTYLDRALVRRPFQIDGQDSLLFDGQLSQIFAIQNAAFARVHGLQGSIEISPGGGFLLLSQYNWQRGEEQMDNGELSPSRHAAPGFGLSRLSYGQKTWQFQTEVVYNASLSFDRLNVEEQFKPELYARDALGRPFSPSWYSLNLRFRVNVQSQLSLSAGIENLSDQRYRPYSSGMAAAGRNLVCSLQLKF